MNLSADPNIFISNRLGLLYQCSFYFLAQSYKSFPIHRVISEGLPVPKDGIPSVT